MIKLFYQLIGLLIDFIKQHHSQNELGKFFKG